MRTRVTVIGALFLSLRLAGGALADEQSAPLLDAQEVTRIVLAEFPRATIDEIELETEDGRLVYEVELITADGHERELHVDAKTGKMIKIKRD
ncbi:PepSY domain-containing protein [Nitrospira sp. Kam-Ns4a]